MIEQQQRNEKNEKKSNLFYVSLEHCVCVDISEGILYMKKHTQIKQKKKKKNYGKEQN